VVVPDHRSYVYLLGLYLGDGTIGHPQRTHQLRIHLDASYPEIVTDAAAAMQLTVPDSKVYVRLSTRSNMRTVESASVRWPELLPQDGPGRKHERPIVLQPWQRDLVAAYPQELLRGLIHSDGCRTVNRFSTTLPSGRVAEYAYPRYFFSNMSPDIRALFCSTCDALGVRWTQSNHRNISVSHRRSVAALDAFIGPKA
jgi:hypothetical protein